MRPNSNVERRPPPKVEVGDVMGCTIVDSLGGRRFLVESRRAPRGWRVVLEAKNPNNVHEGDHTDYWVVRVDPMRREILVRDGTHGRLPITEAMRLRYLLAVRGLIEPETLNHQERLEALAEAKGMISRIVKQDSADWLSVFQLLGKPRLGSVERSLDEISQLRDILRDEQRLDQDLLERATRPFHDKLEEALGALTYIEKSDGLDEGDDSEELEGE